MKSGGQRTGILETRGGAGMLRAAILIGIFIETYFIASKKLL